MTTFAPSDAPTLAPAPRSPGWLLLLPGSILAFLYPKLTRNWAGASLLRAGLIAAFNTIAGIGWCYLIVLAYQVWYFRDFVVKKYGSVFSVDAFKGQALSFHMWFLDQWHTANVFDRLSPFVALMFALVAIYLIPFFVILPFAARPGPNKPCLRHAARAILLGTSVVHWWGAVYFFMLLLFARNNVTIITDDYARTITPMLFAFFALAVWTLFILVCAARREYRTPADMPQPHDPWCDDCGYTLTGLDPAGRCPECGRLIADSLGPHNRQPTPWEADPRFTNAGVVFRQLRDMILRPRTLFFSMPTLSGQGAAQRWLIASALALFVAALPILPALYLAMGADFNFSIVPSSLVMSLAWAVFGLMMVGIESAGLATFSRLRKLKVYLATASKVTAYSCFLMIPWVLLGGAQLVAYTAVASLPNHPFMRLFHLGIRGEQVALAVSLTIAHIGGLLWYEITVYRGIRAIQFANK